MKKLQFEGRTAIVTGAGRSLGRTYALELAKRGTRVVVCDIGQGGEIAGPWAESVVAEIEASGGHAVSSLASVATPDGAQEIIDTAVKAFGTVDIVINNAGFPRLSMFENFTADDLDAVADVNLKAAFHVTRAAWKVMKSKRYGRVVLTSSSSVFGMQGNSTYVAAKAGLIGLARSLALEGAPYDIRVNCLFPYAASNIRQGAPSTVPDVERGVANALLSRRTQASVAPLVLYLCNAACSASGEIYSALAGRYARVFLGLSDGWIAEDANNVTPEQIAEHFAEISDATKHIVPRAMIDELESTLARLQALRLLP